MDIDRVILFISSFSQNCVPCLHFIRQHGMPVHIIKLDTAQVRERVRNGKYFQITNVPTLLVTYTDGNLQLFQGQAKILEWLNRVLVQRNQPPTSVPQATTKVEQPRRVRIEEPEEEPLDEESEEETPAAIPVTAKKAKAKGTAAKSKKKPPVKFKSSKKRDEEDENVELILGEDDEPQPPVPPPAKRMIPRSNPLSTGKGKTSGMASLVEQARKMEQERKSALGYDEKDLPKYG